MQDVHYGSRLRSGLFLGLVGRLPLGWLVVLRLLYMVQSLMFVRPICEFGMLSVLLPAALVLTVKMAY